MVLEDIKNILIVKLDHIGDVILSTPVYQAIKKTYPNSFLRVVVGPWAKSVLINNPFVDEIIEYAAPWLDYNGFYDTKDSNKVICQAINKILSRPNDELINAENVRVAIFPGAGVPWKKWPIENFLQICERLNQLNISPIIIGHSSEADFSEFIDSKAKVIDLIGKTNTVHELAALLSQCNVLLSNDSAPVHVAESVGTKCVVITKPNSLPEFGLKSYGNITLGLKQCKSGAGCPSFVFGNAKDLPKACNCIQSIGVDTVEQALLSLLGERLYI